METTNNIKRVPWNKGRKETRPEVLAKISESQKKRPKPSIETRKKLSEAMKRIDNSHFIGNWKGKKQSPEHIAKRVAKKLGSKMSDEAKNKMSLAKVGKKRPLWVLENQSRKMREKRAGTVLLTKLAEQIRKCFKYRQWRSDVFERDNWTCQVCFKRGGITLNADHIKPFALVCRENNIKSLEDGLNCEELWNINNGRTLCLECHKKTPSYLKPC